MTNNSHVGSILFLRADVDLHLTLQHPLENHITHDALGDFP